MNNLLIVKSPQSAIISVNPQQSIRIIDPNFPAKYDPQSHTIDFGYQRNNITLRDQNGTTILTTPEKSYNDILKIRDKLKEYFAKGYIGVNAEFLTATDNQDATNRSHYLRETLAKERIAPEGARGWSSNHNVPEEVGPKEKGWQTKAPLS